MVLGGGGGVVVLGGGGGGGGVVVMIIWVVGVVVGTITVVDMTGVDLIRVVNWVTGGGCVKEVAI